MEEWIGALWHRAITHVARDEYPHAAVALKDIDKRAGILFRALGGDAGLRIAPAIAQRHSATRRWLARIAGTNGKAALAGRDHETLSLPESAACFPSAALNHDLYLWLVALAACDAAEDEDWIMRNQQATLRVLERYPGLAPLYQRLVDAHIALRTMPHRLSAEDAAVERAIVQALQAPGSVAVLPEAKRSPAPVVLWLYPATQVASSPARGSLDDDAASRGGPRKSEGRHHAKRVDATERKDGMLLLFRAESLFSWGEYVKVNRRWDDDENPDAATAARDMDTLAVTRDRETIAAQIRFDLDLPAAAQDDHALGDGILLPEWDWRRRTLISDQCRVQPLEARDAQPVELPEHLRRTAKRLRAQFSALTPARLRRHNQPDGEAIDLDAYVRAMGTPADGRETGCYVDCVRGERDLACLVLADLSLSTDAWVSDESRVIDVVKDSLLLFSEAMTATGDRFALYGFSSRTREHVRLHVLKNFADRYDAGVRGRINAIKPGFYTRMGTAIRFANEVLAEEPARVKLLLLLTDGKPHDLDHYDGRYGIEDTRMSWLEARRSGIRPFCVTIDPRGASYLPHCFGANGYAVIREPGQLPLKLLTLYAQLAHV